MISNEDQPRIPQNDPSKAMDSKKEVEQSPDAKTDQDFPGYPHYPAKEDMMNKESGDHRVDADVERMAAGSNASGSNQRHVDSQNGQQQDGDDQRAEGEDDTAGLAAIDSKDDEIGLPQNVSNEDLDANEVLPGSSFR